jgi:alpha-beta hydrolase superfamily lysophospholipase
MRTATPYRYTEPESRSKLLVTTAVLCYSAWALLATQIADSLIIWLIAGVAPPLLLDRLALGLLAPPTAKSRKALLAIRAGYVAVGAAACWWLTDGQASWQEALLLAAAVSLFTFLFEFALEWGFVVASALRGAPVENRSRPGGVLCLSLVVAVPPVLLHPMMAVHPLHRLPELTPSDLGYSFEELRFTSRDGTRLAGWFIPAPDARGTIVYCHGYGENRGQVMSLLHPLREQGFNVLSFDFRGHGDSQGRTVTFGPREINDLLAACDLAKERGAGRPIVLVGVSMGAAIALQALPQLPEVKGVWVDTAFGRLATVLERHFAFLPARLRPAFVRISNALLLLDCGFWASEVNPIRGLAGLQVPIYFCHGRADRYASFDEARLLYQTYGGPKQRYWVDDTTHESIAAPARDEYYRRLGEFVEHCVNGQLAQDRASSPF